ncbi:Cyclin-sds-like protein [Quillaja saponaria]|uniref:B-like cyclin n=1 Tax=Quillaja saponaria TaxID=32244 RepID=A0AAD7L5V5_QUISA|nr:Cyclin-sds-like protein [Quillaja saponaria]
MKTKAFKLKQQYKAKPTPIIQKYLRSKFPCRKRAHFRLIHSPFSGEKNLRSKFPSRKRAHIRLINSPFSVEKKEFRRRRKQSQISVNLFISYLNSGLSEFFVNSSICSCFGRDISCYSSIFQVSPESKKRSDLRKRQFSELSFEDAFDLQSEIFQGNSDVDFSDYAPSNFLEYIIQYTAMSVHIDDEYPNTEVARIEDVDGEEIYQMLRKIERCQVFLPKYAEKFCSILNQQRSQMVQWIIEESSMKGLRDETIFLSIILLGQFVGKGYFRAKRNLQILGIACLTLATWIEEKLLHNRYKKCVSGWVFSSEIGRWSLIDVSCSKGFTCFLACSMGVAYNGRLYFLNANGTLVYNPYGVDTIQQQCHSIDFPISFTYKSKALACLGLSCGYLRLSQFSSKHYDGEDSVLVWELKDFGNETRTGTWQLMHKICFNPEIWNGFDIHRQILEPAGKIYYPIVLSFHPYNSNIMYIQYTDVVFSCNLLTQTFEIVSDGDNSMSSPLNAPYANQYAKKAFPIVLPWWPTPIPYCDRVYFQY